MKKFSFFSNKLLLLAVLTVFTISCQKEQVETTEPEIAATDNNRIVGVSGDGPYAGSIAPSYAASLANNYQKKYGDDDDNVVERVEFKAKDLIAFINGLQAKYKSDVIYVNFGVYGKGALPVNSKDYGRLTVFFTGNKIPAPATPRNRRSDGILEEVLDEFLNHGQLNPPPNF